jgi:hypothetical protein
MQTYPASPADLAPRSFKTGAYGYFVTLLAPTLFGAFFAVALWISHSTMRWALIGLVISLLAILLSLLCMKTLSLEIVSEGISYSGPFRRVAFVSYSEISTVVFLDHRLGFWRFILRWTMIITPKTENQKPVLKVPLTLFPSSAYDELARLLHPAVWRTHSDPAAGLGLR